MFLNIVDAKLHIKGSDTSQSEDFNTCSGNTATACMRAYFILVNIETSDITMAYIILKSNVIYVYIVNKPYPFSF